MADTRITSVIIVGGGTAGWMAACALANRFSSCKITLVESSDIGTIGVGEATVPYLKNFLRDLKIDELDFMRKTRATYKLGIQFAGWRAPDANFFHPFAGYGARIARLPFQHFWTKMKRAGKAAELDHYCLASQMALQERFALPKPHNDVELSSFNYAFHFDAALFAQYLADLAQNLGVVRVEGRVSGVQKKPDTGFVRTLHLESGATLTADFFLDCSGFRGLLIGDALGVDYEDWGRWLPCDTAVAVPSTDAALPAPYTLCRARAAGWQWRIPLQQRTGNGYVFASSHLAADDAVADLLGNLPGEALAEPQLIRFTTGIRRQAWCKNVFSVGLASGFLEPLESTGIYMIQSSLEIFLKHFPTADCNPFLARLVNRQLRARQERLRDFLILHYWGNRRPQENFWADCRSMAVPDSLLERVETFRYTGRVPLDDLDFFQANSWLAMFAGFELTADYYHPAVDEFPADAVERELTAIRSSIQAAVVRLPSHAEFLRRELGVELGVTE